MGGNKYQQISNIQYYAKKMQNSKINMWLRKFDDVFTAQKKKSAGYEGPVIGITMADQSRHRRGEDQDRGDHLERRGDPETGQKIRFRQSLKMTKRPRLICASATPRISSALFLHALPYRVSRGEKKQQRQQLSAIRNATPLLESIAIYSSFIKVLKCDFTSYYFFRAYQAASKDRKRRNNRTRRFLRALRTNETISITNIAIYSSQLSALKILCARLAFRVGFLICWVYIFINWIFIYIELTYSINTSKQTSQTRKRIKKRLRKTVVPRDIVFNFQNFLTFKCYLCMNIYTI